MRTNRQIRNFFKKSSGSVNRFFSKGGQASDILHDASVGLRKTGNTLSQINTEAGKILNNPIVGTIAAGLGPEGMAGLAAARGVNKAIGLSGNLATQGSALTKQRNYNGNVNNVVNSVIERSSNIGTTALKAKDIQFS